LPVASLFFYRCSHRPPLPSFPTRRSSDLGLHLARRSGRTSVARATVTATPFGDNLFDLATSFDVLYSLEAADEQAAVDELFRILDRKSTRLNSSHLVISYAVFCLKKKKIP